MHSGSDQTRRPRHNPPTRPLCYRGNTPQEPRMTSSAARIVLGLGLASVASVAMGADQGLDREVRQSEPSQKSVAALTSTTAKQMDTLVDEFTFNRLGDESQAKSLN